MIDISPLVMKLIGAVALVAAVVIGWISFAEHYEHKGRDKTIAAIAAKDERAISDVKAATQKVDDCSNAGRTFNTVSGLCDN